VGGYRHDEVGVEGGADPFQWRDGGHDAACFRAGRRGLGHAGAGGEFGLGRGRGLAAFADGVADREGPACRGVSLPVLFAAAALAGEYLVVGVLGSDVSSPPGRARGGPGRVRPCR
jgi:hypothetical protein